ncbi:MAG: tRNA (adenosine(37)-N6)-dimethylallyltransferase MiaA [Chthoniobacterales bacterium]
MTSDAFYIVGPTATGKSEIAAQVAQRCDGEIVSADAFQVYAGLDVLTAKPDAATRGAVPHYLIGTCRLNDEMNAEKFRRAALAAIAEIHQRRKPAFVVGGTGMYVQALTHGLSPLPRANARLRERLDQLSENELFVRLRPLDPETAVVIDRRNKRRLVRALEVCLLSGRPVSAQRQRAAPTRNPAGVFLFRDRVDLYERINARVEAMFSEGVVEEVRAARAMGPTAEQTLGLRQIRDLLAGRISQQDCVASIQQATRRYAKRQLTWFQRQTSFEPLNFSHIGSSEAIDSIARKARLSFAQKNE